MFTPPTVVAGRSYARGMLFSRAKTQLVTADDALPGRPQSLPHVPELHAVNGNRIQGTVETNGQKKPWTAAKAG